jgi:hypothetical protein
MTGWAMYLLVSTHEDASRERHDPNLRASDTDSHLPARARHRPMDVLKQQEQIADRSL